MAGMSRVFLRNTKADSNDYVLGACWKAAWFEKSLPRKIWMRYCPGSSSLYLTLVSLLNRCPETGVMSPDTVDLKL